MGGYPPLYLCRGGWWFISSFIYFGRKVFIFVWVQLLASIFDEESYFGGIDALFSGILCYYASNPARIPEYIAFDAEIMCICIWIFSGIYASCNQFIMKSRHLR